MATNAPVPYRAPELRPASFAPLPAHRSLLREMDRLFGAWPALDVDPDGRLAPVDLRETDEAYVLEIDLHGVDKADVAVEVMDRTLTVRGQRREPEGTGLLRRRGRAAGEFRYTWSLPADVDGDGAQAGLDRGVLTIQVPKSERSRPRTIAIS